MNPLLEDWTTPFALPPFDAIEDAHFAPAFEAALAEATAEIAAIAESVEPPSFANTIEAMERAGRRLGRVLSVFYSLAGAHTNDTLEALQREFSPKLAAYDAEMLMNPALFARVEALHERRDELDLDLEEDRLLDLYHRMFVRAGARLEAGERARLKANAERLAALGTQFGQNVLADERAWELPLAPDELEGLPDDLVAAMEQAANERGHSGHVVTLSRSIIVPFLQFSPRRELREKAFRAWVARGQGGGPTDNRTIVAEMLELRAEKARLLGYADFAEFKLETEMAKTPEAVRDLLTAVWTPAQRRALADGEALAELMRADGINGPLEPWDWRYYARIRRAREHDLDEAALKPYLPLDGILAAAFDVGGRLFGLGFHAITPDLYHPDARAWEVRRDGRHLGIYIGDFYARPSKRSGAWCATLRSQRKLDAAVSPVAINVCNFAKAPEGEADLLTFDDAHTLFHEMGHALHVLLSDVTYEFLSGTRVAGDFVELPSQLFEHWLETPEVLATHARHADTGAAMPRALMDRLIAARNFDIGFATVEYLASAFVDLDLHSGAPPADPMLAQGETLARIGMPDAIVMRHATPNFQHVFAGGSYAAGYYSYLWSEVMDADAFAAFRESGDVFDQATARRLAEQILSRGGTAEEADLYVAFRGRMPGVEALLAQRGLDRV